MLFNSLSFLVFLGIVYGLYLGTMRRLRVQNGILLAASYFFYGWWDWRFLSLLAFSTALDYATGWALDRRVGGPGAPADAPYVHGPRARKTLVAVSMAVNLGFLG